MHQIEEWWNSDLLAVALRSGKGLKSRWHVFSRYITTVFFSKLIPSQKPNFGGPLSCDSDERCLFHINQITQLVAGFSGIAEAFDGLLQNHVTLLFLRQLCCINLTYPDGRSVSGQESKILSGGQRMFGDVHCPSMYVLVNLLISTDIYGHLYLYSVFPFVDWQVDITVFREPSSCPGFDSAGRPKRNRSVCLHHRVLERWRTWWKVLPLRYP